MSLPPGIRFRPSKKELIRDWLMPKNMGYDSQVDQFVATVDLYKCEPRDLPHKSKMPDVKKWYFFCVRDQLQGKCARFKRKTKAGYWKSTCEELKITDDETKECIGTRRILVFHEGPSPGKRTDWVLHEYALYKPLPNQKASYVICRLKKKKKKTGKAKKAKKDVNTPESLEGEIYGIFASELEIPIAHATVTQIDDRGKDSESFTQPLHWPKGHNEMAASIRLDDSEECLKELLNNFCVEPYGDGYGETLEGLFGDASQRASYNMDAEAVDRREKVFCSSQPHLPYLDNGKPGGNITSSSEVPSTATLVVNAHAKDSESFIQQLTEGHNEMLASRGFAESKRFVKELSYISFPHEDRYEEAIDDSFGDASQLASLEMTYFPDSPVSRNMDAEGVDEREKVFRSLAHGE